MPAKKPSSRKASPRPARSVSETPVSPGDPELSAVGFPVVAMGASAGGLEAFSIVLRNLPVDTGMAFVLVQHLDLKHESMLVELLSRSTHMPVAQVREGVKIAPNCVYVIPPNSDIALRGGAFCVTPRTGVRGLFMPIDHFLRSLAEDAGSRAIGVILSGTSSDGLLGIEAIKGEGGIIFAQDEKSAKYDGMPHAAAASGCVDFILPPEGIAGELARIAQHPYVRTPHLQAKIEPALDRPELSQPLERIFALLRAATGVDFSLYRHTTIRRRIELRMAVHRLEKLEDYSRFVEQNPGEVEALHGELLIKLTRFFRDPEAFQALKASVFPEITRRPSGDSPIRIWCPAAPPAKRLTPSR